MGMIPAVITKDDYPTSSPAPKPSQSKSGSGGGPGGFNSECILEPYEPTRSKKGLDPTSSHHAMTKGNLTRKAEIGDTSIPYLCHRLHDRILRMAGRSKQASAELQEERERWICVFKEGFDKDCTVQDVQELKPAFVFSIYLQFTKIFLGASLDNMKLIGLNCPEDMQKYPEAYEKSILTPKVAHLLSWFFNARYGNSSFTFEDLICATPTRTRLFFNYIADFVYDFTEWQSKIEEIINEVDQRRESVTRLEEERSRLASSIQQLRKQKAKNRIAEEEALQVRQALADEVDAKKEEKAAVKRQFEATRDEVAQIEEALVQTNAECESLSEMVRQLECCVVSQQERDCLKQREQQLRQVAADVAARKTQLADVEKLASETDRSITLLKNTILPLEHNVRQQWDQITSLQDTEDLAAHKRRSVAVCDELDHETSVLRQRLAQLEETRRAGQDLRAKTIKGIEADIQVAKEMLNQQHHADEKLKAEDKSLTEELEGVVMQLNAIKDEEARLDVFFRGLQTQLMEQTEQHSSCNRAALERFIDEVRKRRI
ncbi:Kinetochore protein Nuf2 [Trinorchestia longiramus]|nr:Kinetochore protein Nuf2 [Trinorchestia longiramus]